MLIDFFFTLRDARVPVTIKEFLTLLEALEKSVIAPSLDDFYYLARLTLVKDEAHFDKFDRAFGAYFKGVDAVFDAKAEIPLDWLLKRFERELTPEQKAAIEKLGYDKLMDRLEELLKEQKERHEGGSKWIGTGGTSPFGNSGTNPEGVRIGGKGRNRSAVKVWDQRSFRDYDDERELGTRNIKVALRRLRKFARQGAEEELALDDTIRATASNAGYLDIKMQPERKNRIKVLMLLDVGGTMDDHIERTEELFSAAKAEFKHMDFFYFHNCVYDYLWKNNRRRHAERFPTWDVLRKYPPGYAPDLRWRRHHEPVRGAGAGRLGRIQQRGSRRRLAGALLQYLPQVRLAQPGAGKPVAVPAVDRGDPPDHEQPHVPDHARRAGAGDATAEQVTS